MSSTGSWWPDRCFLWRLLQMTVLSTAALLHSGWAGSLDGGGRLSGTITDSSGAVMIGVAVQAVSSETGLQYNAVTNSEGFYAHPALPIGHYEIRIDYAGFKPYRQKNLDITSGSASRADVALVLGPRSEAITIEESPIAVETGNTQVGELIGATKMANIPVNGRSYTDLLARTWHVGHGCPPVLLRSGDCELRHRVAQEPAAQ